MDFTRTRGMDWVAGGGGLLLLISLFLPWYSVSGFGVSGWESLTVIDVVLALAALLGIAVPLTTAACDAVAVPLVVTVVAAMIAVLAVLLVLIRVVFEASPSVDATIGVYFQQGRAVAPTLSRDWGLWVAAVAALVTTFGSWRALADERTPGIRPAPEPQRQPVPPPTQTASG